MGIHLVGITTRTVIHAFSYNSKVANSMHKSRYNSQHQTPHMTMFLLPTYYIVLSGSLPLTSHSKPNIQCLVLLSLERPRLVLFSCLLALLICVLVLVLLSTWLLSYILSSGKRCLTSSASGFWLNSCCVSSSSCW